MNSTHTAVNTMNTMNMDITRLAFWPLPSGGISFSSLKTGGMSKYASNMPARNGISTAIERAINHNTRTTAASINKGRQYF
jgi:hypothetical protein